MPKHILPVRYTIILNLDRRIREWTPDPKGQWIFDPDRVIDVPKEQQRAVEKWLCPFCYSFFEGDGSKHRCKIDF